MKVFIHKYGMALLSMLMCVFLTVTASPVSTQIQGAMTDVVNQATNVANFDNLNIVNGDGSNGNGITTIGSYNGKNVVKATLDCSIDYSDTDISSDKSVFSATVQYEDGSIENIDSNKLESINKCNENDSGIDYTGTIKGDKKSFITNVYTVAKLAPIYMGWRRDTKTIYFANNESDIKKTCQRSFGNVTTWFTPESYDGIWGDSFKEGDNAVQSVLFLTEVKPVYATGLFNELKELKTIINPENLNLENCINTDYMFFNCSALENESLNNINFNMKNIKSMQQMFCRDYYDGYNTTIKKINFKNVSFDHITSLNSLNNIFLGRSLEEIDFGNLQGTNYNNEKLNLDYHSIENINKVYVKYQSTKDLILSSVNASHFCILKPTKIVVSENDEHSGVYAAYDETEKTLYFSNNGFNLSKYDYENADIYVSSHGWTFGWDNYRKDILRVVFLNEISPEYCEDWFYDCSNLSEIENMENLNLSKCKVLKFNLSNCISLKKLNLGNIDFTNIEETRFSFAGMSPDIKIYTKLKSTKELILGLSDRPSAWTSDNIIVQ